jgi:hypothetical protein
MLDTLPQPITATRTRFSVRFVLPLERLRDKTAPAPNKPMRRRKVDRESGDVFMNTCFPLN